MKKLEHRNEIDGLRAIAVLSVIFYHAGFDFFSGGYVGVDVFFVISGYLITLIILDGLNKNEFTLLHFFERRIRRILPALFFIILIFIPFSFYLTTPNYIKDYSQALASISIFSSNFLFWYESGYFDTASELKPLIHTWSLSVEEQFYLFFPILMIILFKTNVKISMLVITIILVLSVILSDYLSTVNPELNFFLTLTRIWELLIGSLGGFITYYQKFGIQKFQKYNMTSFLGLILVFLPMYTFNERTPYPSYWTLVPTLGTLLLILFATNKTLVGKFLSLKFFVGIGLISYSTYLWHQPIFAFTRHGLSYEPSIFVFIVLIFVTLILSFFTWKYIEIPFRNKNKISCKAVFSLSVIFTILIITLGIIGHFTEGYKNLWYSYFPDKKHVYTLIIDSKKKVQYYEKECVFQITKFDEKINNKLKKCYQKYGGGNIIAGDSHSVDLFNAVSFSSNQNFVTFLRLGRAHSSPSNSKNKILNLIIDQKYFKRLIYTQGGFYLLQNVNNKKANRTMFNEYGYAKPVPIYKINKDFIEKNKIYLEQFTKYLDVIWFGPRIEHHIDRKDILKKGCNSKYYLRPNQEKNFTNLDNYLEKYLSKYSSVKYISQIKAIKVNFEKDLINCKNLFWRDGDHWSYSGAKLFGKRIKNVLFN